MAEKVQRELDTTVAEWWYEHEHRADPKRLHFLSGAVYGFARALRILEGGDVFIDRKAEAWYASRKAGLGVGE